ncbi:hypothetical protein [Phytoactinopolyspora halophila]|nr:hypothetical protein [Phytoactinopolyspora halophila]
MAGESRLAGHTPQITSPGRETTPDYAALVERPLAGFAPDAGSTAW